MTSPKIVVVGGGTAGLVAADAAKKTRLDTKVVVLCEENMIYRRPALTSLVEGTIKKPSEISMFPLGCLSSLGIETKVNVRVAEIDVENRLIKCVDSRGSVETVDYDRLVLATGGYVAKPKIEGVDKPGVFTLRTHHDALEISRWAQKTRSATVIGAGFVGLLVAGALVKRGLKVNILVRSRILRRGLEEDLARTVQLTAERYGVKVLTGTSVEEIGGSSRVEWIETSAGKVYSDLVVIATGVKPRIELAEASGIAVGKFGIALNQQMQTSVENIYAAGDCTEVTELITGRKTYIPIGSLAAAEGQIAGSNSAGGAVECEGFLRAQNEDFFDLHIASIGYTTGEAREVNLKAQAVDVMPTSLHLPRSAKGLHVKLIVNADNNIIGAQTVASRYDLLAKSYSPILLNFVREGKDLTEALREFKVRYRNFSNHILWKSQRGLSF